MEKEARSRVQSRACALTRRTTVGRSHQIYNDLRNALIKLGLHQQQSFRIKKDITHK